MELNTIMKDQKDELVEEFYPIDGMVILQPIAMRVPNSHGIYSPSKLRAKKEINFEKFLLQYIDRSKKVRVCFDDTLSADILLQKSEVVKAYYFGGDGWYTVISIGFGESLSN